MVTLGPQAAKHCTRGGSAVGLEYDGENEEAVAVLSIVLERCGGE